MIKILYVIDKMKAAGAQTHLAEVVLGLDKAKFDARIVTLEELDVKRIYGLSGIRGLFKLVSLIKKERFDIVQTYLFSATIFGNLAAKFVGVPIIISSRRDVGLHREGKWYHRLAYRFAHSLAIRVIAVSNAVKSIIIKEEGVRPEKIEVIYNGVDVVKFDRGTVNEKGQESLKRELGIESNELVVGMVANFSWIKGHEVLIEAAPLIIKEMPNVKFMLVGDGVLLERCKLQVASEGVKDKFIFLGRRTNVTELLSIMDVSLNLSYSEGMSNTILESMAAGVPVVATAVDGNLETVSDGITGILIPSKDFFATSKAIVSLLKNQHLREKMGRNSKQIASEKFQLSLMIKKMEDLYLDFAEKKSLL